MVGFVLEVFRKVIVFLSCFFVFFFLCCFGWLVVVSVGFFVLVVLCWCFVSLNVHVFYRGQFFLCLVMYVVLTCFAFPLGQGTSSTRGVNIFV